jgi:hypothetical protein
MSIKLFSKTVIDNDIRVKVPTRDGEQENVFVFDRLDKVSHKTYTDMAIGRGGRRRGNPDKAVYWLFDKKCKAIEGLTEDEQKQLDEAKLTAKQVMLADTNEYGILIDMVVGRYISIALPDTEEVSN